MSEYTDETTDLRAPTEPGPAEREQASADVADATPPAPAEDAPRPEEPEDEDESEQDDSQGDDEDDEDDSDDEDDLAGDDEDDEASAEGGARRGSKRENLMNEGEIAADYLEELLDIADLDGDIDTFVEGGRARVSVVNGPEVLVGRDGEVLDALQELCRLAIMTETGKRSRVMVDIAGHRDKRRKVLEEMAQDAVAEVKDTGEAVRLVAMNPYERKIVHDVVAAAGLVSESEGQEPQRRVVVLPE